MIGKTPKEYQMSIFEVALESFIDMNHELVLLASQIDWPAVESEFVEYYCADNGRPSVPIRRMVGMMTVQKRPPMNPADLTKFRIRIGAGGVEKIFKLSLMVNAEEITKKEMRLRTIARAMVSDIARKKDEYQMSYFGKDIEIFHRVINQERSDKDKVYSFHEPQVECISKGKDHKKYEFGNKSGIAKTGSGLIVSAIAFEGNPYDGHTLGAHLEQITRLTGHTPKEAVTDRGYRGNMKVEKTEISIPTSGTPGQSYYQKQKTRK